MAFKSVGEIMIPLDDYPHLPHWFTLRQALAEMEGAQYDVGGEGQVASPRSALVFDEAYRLLGQLRRRDIFRGLGPHYLTHDKVHVKGQDFAVDADPNLLEQAALGQEPHLLTHYLRELANGLHTYYNAHQFLVDDPSLRDARLKLILATRQVLMNGLNLLGVSAPERM